MKPPCRIYLQERPFEDTIGWELRLSATTKEDMSNKNILNTPTDNRIFLLVDNALQLVWELFKAGDKSRLEEFRERLIDVISFADFELHELEIRSRITALCEADIDEAAANELAELAGEIHELLDFEAESVSA